ncbi:hypothetical protein VT98_13293, partial [Candidatus Electrothrix communis]
HVVILSPAGQVLLFLTRLKAAVIMNFIIMKNIIDIRVKRYQVSIILIGAVVKTFFLETFFRFRSYPDLCPMCCLLKIAFGGEYERKQTWCCGFCGTVCLDE